MEGEEVWGNSNYSAYFEQASKGMPLSGFNIVNFQYGCFLSEV